MRKPLENQKTRRDLADWARLGPDRLLFSEPLLLNPRTLAIAVHHHGGCRPRWPVEFNHSGPYFSQRLSSLPHVTAETVAPRSPPFKPLEAWIGICCPAVHCYPCLVSSAALPSPRNVASYHHLKSSPVTVSLASSTRPGA
ncbi:hypothetical protein PIB30_093364 [Stylosanthes scabra]|uniref:Uncharacterized protein n=1 Tax=Stylosanthes scabra TaxID=79078 RepID=A0ABU6XSS8_9FABA|nr:hypothetical protein [Stylosanthes scabra]